MSQVELLKDFSAESLESLDAAQAIVEGIDAGEISAEQFAVAAQRIDGIMGCAKTLGLKDLRDLQPILEVISGVSEGCKALGYKASQSTVGGPVVSIVASFYLDAIEVLQGAVRDLGKGYVSIDLKRAKKIEERLTWVLGQLQLSPLEESRILAMFGVRR